jgi:gliding motility-associated-like protein
MEYFVMEFKRFFLLILVLLLGTLDCPIYAQKENYMWLFGTTDRGIQFNHATQLPSVIRTKHLPYSSEGNSVICNPATGGLLFYTNGIKVIDSTHRVMPNGTNLAGKPSSAQNGMAVPVPGTCDKFYVFSNSKEYEVSSSQGALYYSLVDMALPGNGTLVNPLGDIAVTKKNIHILNNVGEAVVLIRSNDDFYWALVPLANSSVIVVLKITNTGVSQYTSYNTGRTIIDPRNIRYSSTTRKLAITGMNGNDPLVVCDFNPETGVVSGASIVPGTPLVSWNVDYNGIYDCEWSADGTKLYYSVYRRHSSASPGMLLQYNLAVPASPAKLIYSIKGSIADTGKGLKRGPDNKIYWIYSEHGSTRYIGVINEPNNEGTACAFVKNGFDMGGEIGLTSHKFPDFLIYANSNPQAQEDFFSCNVVNPEELDVLNNDSEPDGEQLSVLIQGVKYGSAVVRPDQKIKYTPPVSYNGLPDTIWYKICDDNCFPLCDSSIAVITLLGKADAGVDQYVCTETAIIEANGYGVWTSEKGVVVFHPSNISPVVTVSGLTNGENKLYWTMTDACQGTLIDSVSINKNLPVEIKLETVQEPVCIGTSVEIRASVTGGSGDYTFIWTDNNIEHRSDESFNIVKPQESTNYYDVYAIDNLWNCTSDKDSVLIKTVRFYDFFIPNLITPNGDGHNELLLIRELGIRELPENTSLEIYNRWGQRIYKNNSYNNNWPDEALSDGIYYYVLEEACGKREYKGWLQVIH